MWRIRYADADGRRVCETVGAECDGVTARIAEDALIAAMADVRRERKRAMQPTRFSDFAEDAITKYVDTKGRRASTRYAYIAVVRDHLEPFFGRMRLDQIEASDVDDYIARKRRKGLSGPTVNRHLNVLRRVFTLAVRARRMTTNPALLVEALDEPDRRLRWRRLQPEEIGAVAGAFDELITAENDRSERVWIQQARTVFFVIYGLGLRRGEIQGCAARHSPRRSRGATDAFGAAITRSRGGWAAEVADLKTDARARRVPRRGAVRPSWSEPLRG